MTESAVNFVLDRLVPLLELDANMLRGVRRNVEYIRDELQSIRGFLRDADGKEESEEVKAWVNQVRDIAYDIEDTLDEFMLRLAQEHQRHGFLGFLYKTAHFIKHFKARIHITSQIQNIKVKIHDIRERRQGYGLRFLEQGSSPNPLCDTWHDIRWDALLLEEAELVGIDKPRETLIGLLVNGESRLEVVSVYGMGGLGKTTLVKKVYDHERVKKHFQHHAWINVSQSFKINDLLKEIIKQLFCEIQQPLPQGEDTMDEDTLKTIVKEFLQQKRYVIIFDDIWDTRACEALKCALPNNDCGSRIMVTTRSLDIASSCKELYGHTCNLKSLTLDDSWTLFCKKTFRENKCPPELQGLSQNILKRCGGLPLAIVAIGGVLSTKEKTLIEWEIVHRSLGSLLESDDKLKSMQNILSLSYNDLPYYLKPCLLYLGIFPEDYLIGSSRLINLWIAEGFVREKERMTVEEVAESHLHELIDRSLIQVATKSREGRVRQCQVHDFLREIILSKLRDQNFGAIVEHNTKFLEKVRRLSIHNSANNVPQNMSFSYLRSLFMFRVDSIPKLYLDPFFSSSRLLRVLDLRDAPLEKLPNEIVNLFHLRYLSLSGTKIKKLPKNMGKLQNLMTLILEGTTVRELPSEIFKLKWLRYLSVYKEEKVLESIFFDFIGFCGQVGIGNLVNLQELFYIDVNEGGDVIRELGSLSQLRRLGVVGLRREDGPELCSSIEKMSNLRLLCLTSQEEEVLDLQFLSSPPLLLQRLFLRGYLEKFPNWISSLYNLKTIYLWRCRLRDNSLEVLQSFPNLVMLSLDRAYDVEELCFKAGGFQKLKVLVLNYFERLNMVRVEEEAMPHLETLFISRNKMLKKVPLGIHFLTNLKKPLSI
ncbi:hypothetical protein HHK36_020181 [Tetracentron sinense]|uniref:Disease resistance protein RPM1-like n=1 Tax=Tetracentron sinense TaxID=13715 RepID=A0A835DBE0_TETSI|nr:hypothetical protein HHK36_020181 [Tetracentron sinense]